MYKARCILGALSIGALAIATAAPVVAAPTDVAADWQMNEGPDSTVMLDSSGNGLDGAISRPVDPVGPLVQTGFDFGPDEAGLPVIGYTWPRRPPAVPPVEPYRIIQVPDNDFLDLKDATATYTVELRYRTKEKFGNIVQKGQAQARGGQFKIQNPQGRPSCLFKGSLGRQATRSKQFLSDNQWHVLTCVREPGRVEMFVDGVFENRKIGQTGTIDNKVPVTIGGKINCDQVETTCDYFSGDIDYVKMSIG